MNRLIKSILAFSMALSVLTFTPKTLHASSEPAMYPSVQSYETADGSFALTNSSRFVIIANDNTIHNEELENDVKLMSSEYLAKGLTSTAMNIHIGLESDVKDGDIVVMMEAINETTHPEGYKIELDGAATITAPNTDGLFYGMRTLQRGLIANDKSLPNGTIVDYPGTNERGFHLDAARKWFGKDWIESLVKDLSYQGFNKLQFHFSENEGFRVESETLETQLTNWRYPSDGYYTKAEILEIIDLCNQYHIEFYPSLDSPGHLDYILNFCPTSWDITDKWASDWRSTQVFDIFDEPEAKQLLLDLFTEYAEFFSEAGCKYFNIGGDEFLNDFSRMSNDQYVQVIEYFNEVAALVKSYGMTPRVWNDGVMYGSYTGYELDKDIEICYWSCPNACAYISKFMENGNNVINYADTFMYFALNSWWMNNANASGEKIYTQWHPGKTGSPGDMFEYPYPEQLLGASYALWCDEPNFMTKENVASHLMMRTRAMMERSWNPTKAVGAYSTFEALANKVGRVAGYQSELPAPGSVTYTDNIGKVTLHFVDEDNNELAVSKQVYGMLDTDFDLEAKAQIYGYRIVSSSQALTGTFTSTPQEITVVYELYTDFSELNEYVNSELVETDYIGETYADYKVAYQNAVVVANNASAHQKDVDEALDALKTAIQKTVAISNYALYVETAYPLQNNGYASGYKEYKAAVDEAKALLYSDEFTADEYKAALNNINNAKNNLVKNPSQSGIQVSASVSAYQSYVYGNMLDGNTNTKCWFSAGQNAGDEITFTFNNVVNMSAIKVIQPSNVGADAILGADVKVAGADGVFETVGTITSSELTKNITFGEREVKVVKIVLTQSIGNWYQISEVQFDYEEIETDSSLKDTILEAEALNIEGKEPVLVVAMINALIDAQEVYANGGAGSDEAIALRAAIDALLGGEVNKAPLNAMIAQADSKVENEYTTSSWNAMKEVYERAVALYENDEATQVEVTSMITELRDAIKALVKRGNKAALEALIAEAQLIDVERASEESVAAFEAALEAALDMVNNNEATQSDVDATCEALQAAIDGLDFGQLKAENLINKSANDKVSVISYSSQYAPESQTAAKVLDYNTTSFWHSDWSGSDVLPQHILFDLGATYDVSDITFLPRQGNSYNGDILEAQVWIGLTQDDLKDAGTYTFKTVGTGIGLQLADRSEFKRLMLENATGRYVKFVVTKSAADTLAGQNQWATMSEIRFYGTEPSEEPSSADKAALNALIAEVEALAEADYSSKSWSNLQTALTAAKDVVADENATQEVVDQAKAGLEAKKAALVNVVAAKEAIAAAEAKLAEADKYTEETVAALTTAYNNAVYAINSNIGYVQADADMHAANINNAIAALVEKPVEPELTAPAKVENVKAKDTNYKTITLTWDASETATAYDVYRKAYDSEEFKLYKTVEDTTVAVTGVMTGKEYAFYVVAKNEAGEAEASATVTKATTLHGKVTLDIEKVSTSTFKLSWNKIDGATRYIVYRKRNDDKLKKVLTLGVKETEYTTAEMPNGDYQFILKAGRYDSKDRVMTKASNTVKGSVEKVAPAVTLKAGTKSIKVSWKKVEGVTHYQVYRAASEDGKYTKLTTTKELSYTAKSLSSGKKYFFKVRGYKQYKSGEDIKYTVYTPYSTIQYAKAK